MNWLNPNCKWMIIGISFTKLLFFMPITKSCRSRHLEFHIGTKNLKIVEDHPMNIHVQFGFNHICTRANNVLWLAEISKIFISETNELTEPNCKWIIIGMSFTKLLWSRWTKNYSQQQWIGYCKIQHKREILKNVPWMVLYKVTVFHSSRIFNMATRANNVLWLAEISKIFISETNELTEEAFWNIFHIGSNVKLSPAVVAILNFISEQKTLRLFRNYKYD
jgi:hypothetical protein